MIAQGKMVLEVLGNITLKTLKEYAKTGGRLYFCWCIN